MCDNNYDYDDENNHQDNDNDNDSNVNFRSCLIFCFKKVILLKNFLFSVSLFLIDLVIQSSELNL